MTRKTEMSLAAGNVFADLGLPNPDTELLRAELTRQIWSALKASAMTQAEAAHRLGVKQPDISRLMSASPTRFSVERLLRMLNALGNDVTISIQAAPKRRPNGRLRIVSQAAESHVR